MRVTTRDYPITHPEVDGIYRDGDDLTGAVNTLYGIVTVFSAPSYYRQRPHSRFTFGWHGRTFVRTVEGRTYTSRGLVTVARRFAREIAEFEATPDDASCPELCRGTPDECAECFIGGTCEVDPASTIGPDALEDLRALDLKERGRGDPPDPRSETTE